MIRTLSRRWPTGQPPSPLTLPSPPAGQYRLKQQLPLGLLLLALSTVFVFGGDRGHFYRPGHHDWVSSDHLAIAVNLSPEHGFLMFKRQTPNPDGGGAGYEPYNRFPIGGYALLKLATLPFADDLSATIHAARMLMLLFFAAAAVLAYLAMLRLVDSASNRWIALTAALLVFSSPYGLYYNDMIHPKTAMDLFGFMLTFHGMVVFVQEGRFPQLLAKTLVALLLGWHVFALLLAFIALGVVGELVRARSAKPGHGIRKHWTASTVIPPPVGRYLTLGAVALLVGVSILAFNLANEWRALNYSHALTELPTFRSMLRRTGVNTAYYAIGGLDWPSFLETQFSRIGGGISLPFSVASRVNDAAAMVPTTRWGPLGAIVGYVVSGACLASLIGLTLVRRLRHRLLLATLALSGFCWSLPMRYNVAFHDYESLFHLGIPLVLFSLVLLGVRRLAGDRAIIGLAIAAAAVFVSSAYEMGRIGHDAEGADLQEALVADFEVVREIAAGGRVVAATPSDPTSVTRFAGARHAPYYYLSGSFIAYHGNLDLADFLLTRDRAAGVPTLTPDNRVMFLYDSASLIEASWSAYQSIRSGRPAGRSHFDMYLHGPDGTSASALSYVKEPCHPDDRRGAFFLNITPVDLDDLAEDRTEHGFESRGFDFYDESGLKFSDVCMVTVDLPDYEIASITTGQLAPRFNSWEDDSEDRSWEASFDLGE